MEASLREMRAKLSAMVRRVQAGEVVIVTSHRKPVARLVPALPLGHSVTDRLLAAGVISQRPKPGGLHRRAPNPLPPGLETLAAAVIEDRG